MAEIDVQSSGGKGAQKAGVKKVSTKVDMTPMVDLGFLLITFFMLTTTMQKPQTMEITMPDKQVGKEEKMKVKESRTVTVLLSEKDKVYWYQGLPTDNPNGANLTNYSAEGIRKALLERKRQIGKVPNPKTKKMEDGIIVLIKPMEESSYKNLIDILDEMNITGVNTYAVVKLAPEDKELMAKADAAKS